MFHNLNRVSQQPIFQNLLTDDQILIFRKQNLATDNCNQLVFEYELLACIPSVVAIIYEEYRLSGG